MSSSASPIKSEGSQYLPSPSSSPSISSDSATHYSTRIKAESITADALVPSETFTGIAIPDVGRNYGTAMVQILVGPGHNCVAFEIHKQVLNDESVYFRELFAAQPGLTSHSLPEIEPSCFTVVHKWLYGNRKAIAQFIVLERLNCDDGIRAMLKLYYLAYHLQFTSIEDFAMNLLGNGYFRSDLCPSNKEIEQAYERTDPGSALRQYMVRQFQQKILTSTAGPTLDELHGLLSRQPALAMDFVSQSRGVLTNGLWRTEAVSVCDFHAHPRDEPCATSKLTFNCIDYAYITGHYDVPDVQHDSGP
ncbi:hypothetical protein N431DRAFT_558880 [Stipitochalara longipes BDJ]|nr:hypothetical protein N431DRAFT_558880 [Stipitochalara longipes BDJ]